MAFWLLGLSLVLLSCGVYSRHVQFINSCPFNIDVEGSSVGVVCSNLGAGGASCYWDIPSSGYSGQFHRKNPNGDQYGFPSATLAEFNLASNVPSQWNYDWFDISIIPPGCPGSLTSYDACWCNGGEDGYDVGMLIQPLVGSCVNLARLCQDRYCGGAYLFPSDNSKTTACTDTSGDWQVTFCPPGSNNDVFNTARSQVPPCKGGGSPPPTQPPATPPATATCATQVPGTDFYGNDISNSPQPNVGACCAYCGTIGTCGAWTYAYGQCYAKTTAGSDHRSADANNVVAGTITTAAHAVADNTQAFNGASSNASPVNQTWIWVGVGAGVVVFVALIIGIVVLVTMKKKSEERA